MSTTPDLIRIRSVNAEVPEFLHFSKKKLAINHDMYYATSFEITASFIEMREVQLS
jgi:hypothetical protein